MWVYKFVIHFKVRTWRLFENRVLRIMLSSRREMVLLQVL